MTVHKLTAGDGYSYLTRQVASADSRRAGQALSDYYAESGSPPGRWLGTGAASAGVHGVVDEAQMLALFGRGEHPVSGAALGARMTRPNDTRRPVAGYDLVFSPVKSVSLLWALGDEATRTLVKQAHDAAVLDILGWLEQNAAFTRLGKGGRSQVDTHGLIAAAFDHADSRAGDPDLHTHVAVSNKVRAVVDRADGSARWLALDGSALFAAGVAASERYNTRMEDELRRRLPVRFEPRLDGRHDRPVRELAGVPLSLVDHFSGRRHSIRARLDALEAEYRSKHGRTPDRPTRLKLAQQATLATREAKQGPRSLPVLRSEWRQAAASALGSQLALDRVLRDVLVERRPERCKATTWTCVPSPTPCSPRCASTAPRGPDGTCWRRSNVSFDR